MQKKSITYVFGSGRIEKLKLDYDIAKNSSTDIKNYLSRMIAK